MKLLTPKRSELREEFLVRFMSIMTDYAVKNRYIMALAIWERHK